MADTPIVTTGVEGSVHDRLEINDFIKNDKYFTLYIRALQALQDVDENQDRSFFGMGGIHGEPFESWNGSSGGKSEYCRHGHVLFPTWHRPYVLQLEQSIHKEAATCAEKFTTNKDDWKVAAVELRQPYWDWVKEIIPPDEVILKPKVKIFDYDGVTKIDVDNPLLQYKFQGRQKDFKTPIFKEYKTTLRQPKKNGDDYTHDVPELKRQLESIRRQMRDNVSSMFIDVADWENFSNHGPRNNRRTNSLEGTHDNIHNMIGGHMRYPSYAAFDPIFHLHHAYVDHLLSLWSAGHKNEQVPAGSADTELLPFRNGATTFWASTKLYNGGYHNTESLGYTYPGMPRVDDQPTANTGHLPMIPNPMLLHPYRIAAKTRALEYFVTTEMGRGKHLFDLPESKTDGLLWTVRIRVKKFEVGGSFSILVFLGEIPEPSEMLESNNLVGINSVFANSTPEECENCQDNIDMIHEGFVHLNSSLAQHALGHMITISNPNDATEAKIRLKEKLNYYVTNAEGNSVQLRYFETEVIRTEVLDPFRQERERLEKNYPATVKNSTSDTVRLLSALEGEKSTVDKVAQLYSTEYKSRFNTSTGHISTTYKSSSHQSVAQDITQEDLDEVEERISRLLPRFGKTVFE